VARRVGSVGYTLPVLRIGLLAVDPPLILAPLAGITDSDFRVLIRRVGGCGLVTMEFLSSEGLTRQNPRSLAMLRFSPEERPLAVQIYGADPDRMAEAARAAQAAGADLVDINMGCPARKILSGHAGAALAADIELAGRVVAAVRAAISVPLTVKLRLGLREDSLNYIELCRRCQGEGVQAVTLHPRTARQQYSGNAEWSHIARLREHLAIPVIGNGDVRTPEDASRMLAETGCDGVMIGRAALTNPWIFSQTVALLDGAISPPVSLVQRRDLIRAHFSEVVQRDDERAALHTLRKFVGWYSHGLPEGRLLRRQLSELASAGEVLGAVESYFSERVA
jgi:tRNA-dihydrouridine synthase B